MKRWFPKRHRDTRFPTSTIIQLWHFQPPLFSFSSPSPSLFLFFRPFFIRATIEKAWTAGRVTSGIFDRSFFSMDLSMDVSRFYKEGGKGWITEKTSGACITPISTSSLCYVRGDRSVTANRIILSNEICERSMSIMLDDRTRSVPIRFFARKIGDGIYFSKKLLFFFENKIGFRLIDCTFDEYRRIFLCNPSLEISLSQRKRNLENQ